jgi:integrase/recombinase XerD
MEIQTMSRKGHKKPRTVIGNPSDSHGMGAMLEAFLEDLRVHNYAEQTALQRDKYLRMFIGWAEQRGLMRPSEITKPILERYQRHLYNHRQASGRPLSFRSQRLHLSILRSWFKWLTRANHILYNPASELELPRTERRLPKHILTHAEVEQVLALPEIRDPLGLRDRAILETFYSTGMRRRELAQLELYDVDCERRTIMIRQGKGKKDRLEPIGRRALAWVEKNLAEARPLLQTDHRQTALFLSSLGLPLEPESLTEYVRHYVAQADLHKTGSCHLFRHTMATLMLENGADIRFIQAMLGHAELSTTQIYTQVAIKKLQEVHEATHPAQAQRSESLADPANPTTSD